MEKEKNKGYAIEEKNQKHLKGMTKFLYIIANILKVFAIIGIVGLVFAMMLVPAITSNIKTSKDEDHNVLNIFDTKLYYNRTDTKVELYERGKEESKLEITGKENVESVNKVFDYLEKNDMTKLNLFAELFFILLIAELVIEVLVFKKAHLFFRNLHEENSPFIKENVELLKNMAKLLIYSLVVSFILGLVSSVVINNTATNEITNIVEIIIVFVTAYVFEYGYNLQKDSKGKIYSE